MAPIRQNRRLNKCVSCRRLKIKCDEAKPSCEYCVSTNKRCVYGSDEKAIVPSFRSAQNHNDLDLNLGEAKFTININTNSLFGVLNEANMSMQTNDELIEENQMLLNHMNDQLRTSVFEVKLLRFFTDYYLKSPLYPRPFPPSVNKLIVRAVQRSSRLKFTVLGLCSMCVYAMGADRANYVGEEFVRNYSSGYLYVKSLEYFQLSLKLIQTQIVDFIDGSGVQTLDGIFESLFSDVFTFLILVMQPFNMVPMIGEIKGFSVFSKNPFQSIPNIAAICKGMKSSFGFTLRSLQAVMNSQIDKQSRCYEDIHDSETFSKEINAMLLLYPPIGYRYEDYQFQYPLPKMLLLQLDDWRKISSRRAEYDIYHHALASLDCCIDVCVKKRMTVGILRWIFLWDHEFFMLLEVQEFASLKLLFYFCCFCCFFNIRVSGCYNEVTNFVEVFKDISFKKFGTWHNEMDKDMYDLVHQDFQLRESNLEILATFIPREHVLNEEGKAYAQKIETDSTSESEGINSVSPPEFPIRSSQ